MVYKVLMVLSVMLITSLPTYPQDLKPEMQETPEVAAHRNKSKWKCWGYFSCGHHHPKTYQGWRKTRRAAIRSKPYVDYAGSLGQVTYSVAQWWIGR